MLPKERRFCYAFFVYSVRKMTENRRRRRMEKENVRFYIYTLHHEGKRREARRVACKYSVGYHPKKGLRKSVV